MSVFALGIALGSALGGIGGGLLADQFGWRHGLIVFSCLSAPLLLLLFTVKEPPRGRSDVQGVVAERPTLRESLRFITSQRALMHIVSGATVATFSGQGLVWWTPAFLNRSHHFGVGDAGVEVGLMSGVGGAAALIATTFIMLQLAKRPLKWQCHFLAWTTLLIAIPGIAAHLVSERAAAVRLLWLFVPFCNVYVGPTLALLQNLTRADMRGVTVAVLLFTANLANLAVAPQLIGLASDLLARHIADPHQSLRIALAFAGVTGVWAATHFWLAIRALPHDIARAGTAASASF